MSDKEHDVRARLAWVRLYRANPRCWTDLLTLWHLLTDAAPVVAMLPRRRPTCYLLGHHYRSRYLLPRSGWLSVARSREL